MPPIDLAPLTTEQLLDLAERAAAEVRARIAAAQVGAQVSQWVLAPRRSILRDSEGTLIHLCSDGTWAHESTQPARAHAADDEPHAGPWVVVELDVADARGLETPEPDLPPRRPRRSLDG